MRLLKTSRIIFLCKQNLHLKDVKKLFDKSNELSNMYMYICSPPRPPEWLPRPAVCSLVETHGISLPSLQLSSCHLHQSEGTKCVRGDKSRVIVHNRTKAVLFDFTQKCIHLLHSLQSIVLFIKIRT